MLIYAIPRVRSSYKLKPVKILLIIYTFKRQPNEFPPCAGLLKAHFRKGKKRCQKVTKFTWLRTNDSFSLRVIIILSNTNRINWAEASVCWLTNLHHILGTFSTSLQSVYTEAYPGTLSRRNFRRLKAI